MPVRVVQSEVSPPFPVNSKQVSLENKFFTKIYHFFQPGVSRTLLYNGSRFTGHQKSKGNQYDVEVMLQVQFTNLFPASFNLISAIFQHVDEENAYLCGYLKIKNLTDEYPEMVTFFDGEIISDKHPFLTRKWDADEDVDKKHWVGSKIVFRMNFSQYIVFRANS